jgi:phosphomannomutase
MDNWDKIFKAYDIRGIYPEEINKEIAYKIGRAVGRFFNTQVEDKTFQLRTKKEKNIVLARDNRLSSEELFNAVREGIRDESVNFIDIGLSTTPMFYYAVVKLKLDGGIIITASHNPKEYNGFKIIKKNALPVNMKESQEIKRLLIKNDFAQKSSKGHIAITREIIKDYTNEILELSHVNEIDSYRVVVDTANGMAILAVSELAKYL